MHYPPDGEFSRVVAIELGGVMKKILTAFVAALALALTPLVPASGLGYQPVGVDTSTGQQGVFIRDATSGPRVMSIVHDRDQVDVNGFNPFCTTPTSETCGLGPNDHLSITTLLPVCTTVEENCIESLRIYRVGEPVSEAKFVKEVAGLTFAAVESKGIPEALRPQFGQLRLSKIHLALISTRPILALTCSG